METLEYQDFQGDQTLQWAWATMDHQVRAVLTFADQLQGEIC